MSDSPSSRGRAVPTKINDGSVIIRLIGEIDTATAPNFQSVADEASERGLVDVVIDASELGFIDSSGLAVIAELIRATGERGGEVTIRDSPRTLTQLLDITGLRALVLLDNSA